MMLVEQLLAGLTALSHNPRSVSQQLYWKKWNVDFVNNVHNFVLSNESMSTAQSEAVLKIARQCRAELSLYFKVAIGDIDQAINKPQYKLPPFQSVTVKREVRHVGGNMLALRFKMDNMVVQDIKQLRCLKCLSGTVYRWNVRHRVWLIEVNEINFDKVKSLLHRHRFNFDENVYSYFKIFQESADQKLKSTVLIDDSDTDHIYVNVSNNGLLGSILQTTMKGRMV